MRPLALAVAIVVVACTAPPPATGTPSPTPERGVLAVTALLDLSGPGAAIGTAQRNALELWRDQRGQSGATPALRLTVVDLAGSEARLFIELRRAAVEHMADAVLVGMPVTYGDVLGRAVEVAAMPVLFTLPIDRDPVDAPGGGWAFALAPPLARLASAAVTDATVRNVLSPALVLARERQSGDPYAGAIRDEMERRGREPFTTIVLPDGGAVPPVVRSSLSVLRSLHCTAAVAACAPVARDAVTLQAPTFFYLSYLATPAELDDHPDLAARAVWPASRWILPDAPTSPASQAREAFLRSYAERHGPAGVHAATAFDALTLLATAAERGGTDDRARSRAELEAITIPLIATTYSFSSQRHAGSDPADLVLVRWTGSGLAAALPPSFGTGIPTPTPSPSPTLSPSP